MQRAAYLLILLLLASPCWADVTAVGAAYQDGNGWTVLPANGDTYYVSSSIGNDAYNGQSGTDDGGNVGPKATLSAGLALLSAGDHLLLKRGDTWTNVTIGSVVAGTDEDNMTLIGAYGTGDRPKIRSTAGSKVYVATGSGHGNLAFIGIDFAQNNRQTDDGGECFYVVAKDSPGNFLIEDCKIDGYDDNIVFQSSTDSTTFLDGATVRRCIVINSHDSGSHSQGIFTNRVRNLLLEENIFDHNGYTDDWEDTAILASGTTTAYTNGDTLTLTCVRYGDYTADDDGNGLELVLTDTNDASGAVSSVTITPQSDGDNIVVSLDLTTGVASNVVAAAIQAYNSGADFTCTSSGTADLVAADAGTKSNVTSGGLSLQGTIFNHNIYIGDYCNSSTIRGNIFSRASFLGVKYDIDAGDHQFHDNFLSRNPCAGQLGGGPSDGGPSGGSFGDGSYGINMSTYNNCWVEGAGESGVAIGAGLEINNQRGGYFRNNIICNRESSGSPAESFSFIDREDGAGYIDYVIDSNVAYQHRGAIRLENPSTGVFSNVTISNNEWQGVTQNTSVSLIKANSTALSGCTLSDNTYYHGEADDTYTFNVNGSPVSVATWQSTYEATATISNLTSSYTAPTRTATTFATSHANGYASYQEWIDDLAAQRNGDWDTTIMADAANEYIRAGFDLSEYDPNAPSPGSSKIILMLK